MCENLWYCTTHGKEVTAQQELWCTLMSLKLFRGVRGTNGIRQR